MPDQDPGARRRFLRGLAASIGALGVAGCDRLSQSEWFPKVLESAEKLNERLAKAVTGRKAMAQEFSAADLSPTFRSNGTAEPNNPQYAALAAKGFDGYALEVSGLVAQPRRFSLAELRALPSRTQITRHDCVEGWSAIGKWTGAQMAPLLQSVGLKPEARYLVLHCADTLGRLSGKYYESIDLIDAFHPQTILAYDMNGAALTEPHGAPIRLRVERQLGYKHAKYVQRIEAVSSFAMIRGGRGGFWEDLGYEWYAGI